MKDVNYFEAKPLQIYGDNFEYNEILNNKYFPNTYCFTKCLAEKFIEQEEKNNKIFFQII